MAQDKNLLEKVDRATLPRHVGIIMDGNGRWAQQRNMPRLMGHQAGMDQLRNIVRSSSEMGIEVLSIYAFSSENWNRPQEEVKGLMRLLLSYLTKELDELNRENVCIRFMGETEQLPRQVFEAIETARTTTMNNTGLIFNVGINYGGRLEIIRACKQLIRRMERGYVRFEDINEYQFEDYLYTAGLPALDLVIRTSGEERLSNFMLYQAAYAEFVFTSTLWPDFDENEYCKALITYQNRQRRFGAVEE